MAEVKAVPVIPMLKELRMATGMTLHDACVLVASTFGFPQRDGGTGIQDFMRWSDSNNMDYSGVKGPHAVTLLKMLAIKHGRTSVSEQPK